MKLTVITITRNNLAELKLTVASVLEQSFQEIEFIIIDGASSDGTKVFLERQDPTRVTWCSEEDNGISDAFNKGQRMASGEAILFLNAGDIFVNQNTVTHFFEMLPPKIGLRKSIVYGNFIAVTGHAEELLIANHNNLHKTNSLNHQSTWIGRDVYQRFSYDPRLVLGMDYDYWLRCVRQSVPFVKVELPIAKFRVGGRSSSIHYRVHIAFFRYFLRVLNSGKILKALDVFDVLLTGLIALGDVALHTIVPQRFIDFTKKSIFSTKNRHHPR